MRSSTRGSIFPVPSLIKCSRSQADGLLPNASGGRWESMRPRLSIDSVFRLRPAERNSLDRRGEMAPSARKRNGDSTARREMAEAAAVFRGVLLVILFRPIDRSSELDLRHNWAIIFSCRL